MNDYCGTEIFHGISTATGRVGYSLSLKRNVWRGCGIADWHIGLRFSLSQASEEFWCVRWQTIAICAQRNIGYECNDLHETFLHLARVLGRLEVVYELSKSENLDVNAANTSIARQPLLCAVKGVSISHAVRALLLALCKNVHVNAKHEYDDTPLSLAIVRNDVQMVLDFCCCTREWTGMRSRVMGCCCNHDTVDVSEKKWPRWGSPWVCHSSRPFGSCFRIVETRDVDARCEWRQHVKRVINYGWSVIARKVVQHQVIRYPRWNNMVAIDKGHFGDSLNVEWWSRREGSKDLPTGFMRSCSMQHDESISDNLSIESWRSRLSCPWELGNKSYRELWCDGYIPFSDWNTIYLFVQNVVPCFIALWL